MAIEEINISNPDDGQGDNLYVAGGKINANFAELDNTKASKTEVQEAINASLNQKWKDGVRASTTAALPANTIVGLTLVASANGAFPAQDNIAIALTDSVVVRHEADQRKNGIYTLTQVGSGAAPWILTRRSDADTGAELENASVPVSEGDQYKDKTFRQTTDNVVIGTSNIVFVDMGTTEVKPRLSPIAHSAVVNLDGNYRCTKSITGALAYTKGAAAHIISNIREDWVTANGINKPTFSTDFDVRWDNWVNTINTVNLILFKYRADGKIAVYLGI